MFVRSERIFTRFVPKDLNFLQKHYKYTLILTSENMPDNSSSKTSVMKIKLIIGMFEFTNKFFLSFLNFMFLCTHYGGPAKQLGWSVFFFSPLSCLLISQCGNMFSENWYINIFLYTDIHLYTYAHMYVCIYIPTC